MKQTTATPHPSVSTAFAKAEPLAAVLREQFGFTGSTAELVGATPASELSLVCKDHGPFRRRTLTVRGALLQGDLPHVCKACRLAANRAARAAEAGKQSAERNPSRPRAETANKPVVLDGVTFRTAKHARAALGIPESIATVSYGENVDMLELMRNYLLVERSLVPGKPFGGHVAQSWAELRYFSGFTVYRLALELTKAPGATLDDVLVAAGGVEVGGRMYNCLTKAREAFQIPRHAMRRVCEEEGLSQLEAVRALVLRSATKTRRKSTKHFGFTFRGVTYANLAYLCATFGITSAEFNRGDRFGLDLNQYFEALLAVKTTAELQGQLGGHILTDWAALKKASGLTPQRIAAWMVEKGLSDPLAGLHTLVAAEGAIRHGKAFATPTAASRFFRTARPGRASAEEAAVQP